MEQENKPALYSVFCLEDWEKIPKHTQQKIIANFCKGHEDLLDMSEEQLLDIFYEGEYIFDHNGEIAGYKMKEKMRGLMMFFVGTLLIGVVALIAPNVVWIPILLIVLGRVLIIKAGW